MKILGIEVESAYLDWTERMEEEHPILGAMYTLFCTWAVITMVWWLAADINAVFKSTESVSFKRIIKMQWELITFSDGLPKDRNITNKKLH